jgi:opacity protein-like surface antigen
MGWYGSFNLDPSFGWITGASNNRTPPGPLANNIRQTDVQAGFTVAVGHEWKAFRMEGEYTWLWRNDFNTYYHGKNPYNLDAFKNNVQSQTALLNTYWHPARAWGGLGAFDPYVGFGLGGTELEFQNVTRYTFKAPTATVINAYTKESMPGHGNGGTSDAFTYMLSTGINYALSEQWFLNLQYRYVNYGTPVRSGPFPSDGGTATAPNYYSHDLLGGIRYRF